MPLRNAGGGWRQAMTDEQFKKLIGYLQAVIGILLFIAALLFIHFWAHPGHIPAFVWLSNTEQTIAC